VLVQAVDGSVDKGLHGMLEQDLVDLLSGPDVVALLALHMESGSDGRLQLGSRQLICLVVVKLIEELIEEVLILVTLVALLRCLRR
jgi:hypothetical protein